MEKITTVGLDLAKQLIAIHAVDARGQVVMRKVLRREALAGRFGLMGERVGVVTPLELEEHGCVGDAHAIGDVVRVLLAKHGVLEWSDEREGGVDRAGLSLGAGEIERAEGPVEHVPHERDGRGGVLAEHVRPPGPDELGGVEPLGEDQHAELDGMVLVEAMGPLGGAGAGLVGVEREDRARREPGRRPSKAEGPGSRTHGRAYAI